MFFLETAFLLNFNRKGRIDVEGRAEGDHLEHVEKSMAEMSTADSVCVCFLDEY